MSIQRKVNKSEMDLEICKACLATEIKLTLISDRNLKKSFITLSSIKISPKYRLWLCYECINMLKKLEMFQKTCSNAEKMLKEYHKRVKSRVNKDKSECIKLLQWQHRQIKKKQNNISNIISIDVCCTENNTIYSSDNSKAFEDVKVDLKSDTDGEKCYNIEIEKEEMNYVTNPLSLSEHRNCNVDEYNMPLIDYNASHTTRHRVSIKTEDTSDDLITDPLVKYNEDDDGDVKCDNSLEDFDSKLQQLYKHEENICNKKLTVDTTKAVSKYDNREKQEDIRKSEGDKKEKRKYNKNKTLKKESKDIDKDSKGKSDDSIAKDFFCKTCKKYYPTEKKLKIHQRNHSEVFRHTCTECQKKFRNKSQLATHMNNHTGERPFICDQCGRNYISSKNLRAHLQTHGVRMFECAYCGKKFFHKKALIFHIRYHTGVKNHVCDFCGKAFISEGYLQAHRRIHLGIRPFSCPICNKRFTESGSVKPHMRVHTGEKPFSCKSCDLTFRTSTMLRTHEVVHSDVRRYKCDLCPYSAKRPYPLKRHKLKRHLHLSPSVTIHDESSKVESVN